MLLWEGKGKRSKGAGDGRERGGKRKRRRGKKSRNNPASIPAYAAVQTF